MIKFIICACLLARSFTSSKIWYAKDLITLLTVIVSSKENRPEEPSVDSALVQHNRILLVIASVASDCDD